MEIDRGLLALIDDERWQRSHSLATLEKEADRVFADAMRVTRARARLDSALASLGGDEQAIWDVIADVTKFGALVDGVDRKVDALQRIAERRVQQAAAAQGRRTSAILSFLTALTIVTVAVALIGNFLGSRSDDLGHVWWRVLVVALALLASIGLYREAFRERPRKPR
jgi:CHASE3 domain sensor protein